MSSGGREDITQLLLEWSDGDRESMERLVPLVYNELRRIASRYLTGERSDHSLQPSDVVHEAYFRLVDQNAVRWRNRGHFFAIAAQTMRRILVDHARMHKYAKRGGGKPRLSIDLVGEPAIERPSDLVALDDALTSLSDFDPAKARIVERRFFGGLSIDETADVVGTSRATVVRQWRMAKAWLHREFTRAAP